MTDEVRLDGVTVTPEVIETIVSVAAQKVEGVCGLVAASTMAGLVSKRGASKGIAVAVSEDGGLIAELHLKVAYGQPLHDVATRVQHAVSDAIVSMTGQSDVTVDVYVDDIVFPAE